MHLGIQHARKDDAAGAGENLLRAAQAGATQRAAEQQTSITGFAEGIPPNCSLS